MSKNLNMILFRREFHYSKVSAVPLIGMFLLFLLFPQLGQAESCFKVKKCLNLLSKEANLLTLDWKNVLAKMVADLDSLELNQRVVVKKVDEKFNRLDLSALKSDQKKIKELKQRYDELLKLCSRALKTISREQLLHASPEELKLRKEEEEKIQAIYRNEKLKRQRPRGLRRLFSRRGPPPEIVSSVSQKDLDFIFSYLQRKEHIPFNYPDDGCYARAWEMVNILEKEMGLKVGKVFIKEKDQFPLVASTPNHPNGKVHWTYHVAPYLHLKDGDEKTAMVLDPSLFSRPVSVDEWVAKQTIKPLVKDALYYTPSKVFLPSDIQLSPNELDNLSEANELMSQFCLRNKKFLEIDRMKMMGKIL